MRSLNKRGFWMGEEAGKFILGIIAVVLLFLLAFKLAGIMKQSSQLEQARYTLQQIEDTINTIKVGETKNVFIESPRDWSILSLNKEIGQANLPQDCMNQNCLCICYSPESCKQGDGVCKGFEKNISVRGVCGIGGGHGMQIKTFLNCSFIEDVPLIIKIDSKENLIEILLEKEQSSDKNEEIFERMMNEKIIYENIEMTIENLTFHYVEKDESAKKDLEKNIKSFLEKEKLIAIFYLLDESRQEYSLNGRSILINTVPNGVSLGTYIIGSIENEDEDSTIKKINIFFNSNIKQ